MKEFILIYALITALHSPLPFVVNYSLFVLNCLILIIIFLNNIIHIDMLSDCTLWLSRYCFREKNLTRRGLHLVPAEPLSLLLLRRFLSRFQIANGDIDSSGAPYAPTFYCRLLQPRDFHSLFSYRCSITPRSRRTGCNREYENLIKTAVKALRFCVSNTSGL